MTPSEELMKDELAAAWRSIAEYCKESCDAQCCRHGKLVVTDEDLARLGRDAQKRMEAKLELQENGNWLLHLAPSCPLLEQKRCIAYEERPQLCRDYPLLVAGDKVLVSSGCPAAREGKLAALFAAFELRGFRIV